ncbi:conserved exported hypothetical protein [Flavobacterium sp. 9R]|uniref:hypothetical protein n=1 Tax=Flavobacterium sp. 9R TaxID=2653143 RepID=UPI0012EFC05E|nr:hypothetical protein [Flavobacterium sp. 9R]VXB66224.1 conserved exported hypothetical protein [Flavobacterium sp. 9R]
MKKLIVCVGLFFLFQLNNYAQSQLGLADNYTKAETQKILSNQSEKVKTSVENNNAVYIQQVGNFNSANSNIIANRSEIRFNQQGNSNSIAVSKEAISVQQKITQNGDNNTVFDYGGYTNHSVFMDFIQKGNNQSIHTFGTNSLSKDMKITQSGNGSTVIVVNLK